MSSEAKKPRRIVHARLAALGVGALALLLMGTDSGFWISLVLLAVILMMSVGGKNSGRP